MAPDATILDGLISSFSQSTSRIKTQLYIEIHRSLLIRLLGISSILTTIDQERMPRR
jgi:hypothetical protein